MTGWLEGKRALVVGAGSGNDVSAALANGAGHVDAVEIEPVLNEIGRADHPMRPYDNPRVTIHLDDGRSYVRKGLEFPLALWIDLVLSKQRVLELYLNIAEWGPSGQFGVNAGANYAFGRSAENLSPREAALLAAMLPNPHVRSARKPGPGMRRLAGTYMARARAVDLDGCRGRKSAS